MKIFLLASLFMMFGTSLFSQQLTSSQIDTLAERAMKAFDVPGIAVAIIKDGKVIHSKGYGVRSLNTKEKVDEIHYLGLHPTAKLLQQLHWEF